MRLLRIKGRDYHLRAKSEGAPELTSQIIADLIALDITTREIEVAQAALIAGERARARHPTERLRRLTAKAEKLRAALKGVLV